MKMNKWFSNGVVAALMTVAGATTAAADVIAEGKAIAFDKKKGNCLACHRIEGGAMAGDIAPPIILMKVRYPNKEDLRTQIWDASIKNQHSVMPPFGRHNILTESEIDKVTEFIHSL